MAMISRREIEKMDERNAKRKEKPSKKSVENEPIKEKIVDFVGGCETPQIASVIAENVEISVQKASALCRQLVDVDTFKVTEAQSKRKKMLLDILRHGSTTKAGTHIIGNTGRTSEITARL